MEKRKSVSSNRRMHPSEDVGKKRRREAAFASLSSGRHKAELEDDADGDGDGDRDGPRS